jgi:hypothetical protein
MQMPRSYSEARISVDADLAADLLAGPPRHSKEASNHRQRAACRRFAAGFL